jgi:hypothetical protein
MLTFYDAALCFVTSRLQNRAGTPAGAASYFLPEAASAAIRNLTTLPGVTAEPVSSLTPFAILLTASRPEINWRTLGFPGDLGAVPDV